MIDKNKTDKAGSYLLAHNETISIAESVTSGLLQFILGEATNAEKFYQGGITAYNLGQKYKYLGVEPIHAAAVNSVSQQVAELMAIEVCRMFSSDWGISITGYATPVPESGNKLFSYYAVVYKGRVKSSGKLDCEEMPPIRVKEKYSEDIIDELLKLMQGD